MVQRSQNSAAKTIIGKVINCARKQVGESDADIKLLERFIRLYYSHTSSADLCRYNASELCAIAISHWRLLQAAGPEHFELRVFNPTQEVDGWQSTHTVIQLVSRDMPFLVDSMRMEVNRSRLTPHLIVHMGGMRVNRGEDGKINKILAYHSKEDSEIEAPIYMEIDRQTRPEALEALRENLARVVTDVQLAVQDWEAMRARLSETIEELQQQEVPRQSLELNESVAFLEWLLADHFTFLGVRDYEVVGEEEDRALRLIPGSGLGVLRDESHSKVYRQFADMPAQARDLMLSKEQLLVISKTNTVSTVHHPSYTDYIGIKRFDKNGELIGERRLIGLYTSTAYNSNPRVIPFLRGKVAKILSQSNLPLRSHAGKDLMHILTTLPRDDLIQATTDELFEIAMGILHLQERRQVRLFIRKDAYGRFLSCLVFVPRDNFDTDLALKIQDILQRVFHGLEINYDTHFSASILARIHYLVRIDPLRELDYDLDNVEAEITEAARSWQDTFREKALEYFGEERGNTIIVDYLRAFPAGYREIFSAATAVSDVEYIEELEQDTDLGMSFYRPAADQHVIRFKLFRLHNTMPLSDALPILENMGLRVIGEQPYRIKRADGVYVWINDFSMTDATGHGFDVDEIKDIFQEIFRRVCWGDAENDTFNRLGLMAKLDWREISVLRAYTKYLRQTGFTFSSQYVADTFSHYPNMAGQLVELFKLYFSPGLLDRESKIAELKQVFIEQLEDVASLDDDRILRRCLEVICATLRTNYFQMTAEGESKNYITFKLNPREVPELPKPLPRYEIFVYSPRFEGVHLRMSKVARGGLRWSDRREDFRTEVLGLMKAQQVKNALIVPAGAKGGFVAKRLPQGGSREAIMEEGIACYQDFIQGMLDITDNLLDGKVVVPDNTVCHDDEDSYLVVAADKGTATFSDIANQISVDRNFWLGDAFASGGCTGYDHKKMGITARGAWISAERQFQELGIKLDCTEVSVVGVGDMSGDVFGNGMLLSEHLKLVGAYNHMHIFLDPNPNAAKSFEERKRLFALPRSGWDDYNPVLISKGGGVFRRTAKFIKLTPEIKAVLDIDTDTLTPNELIQAMLRAPVDMIWNGGVGTFVKASSETDADVGDRSNDLLRVNANQLRSRVVCEGGNLGFTQRARIEYELNGGRINTDFIDNSAGVDCSDHEVNIKILLNKIMEAGDLTEKQRNNLLGQMGDEVSELVLRNNYHQNRALSYAAHSSAEHMGLYIRYLETQEERGELDRSLEFLPDTKALLERKTEGRGLTRPELSVLLAYSKIILEKRIRLSGMTDSISVQGFVRGAFPTPLRKRYDEPLQHHRLKNEIISTQLSNQLVSDMGITFTYQMQDETGAPVEDIVRAYIAARHIFHMPELMEAIESLDYKVDATVQHNMTEQVVRTVRRAARWFLRNKRSHVDIEQTIADFAHHIDGMYKRLPRLLVGDDRVRLEERRDALIAANVPEALALKVASAPPMYHLLNVIEAIRLRDSGDEVYQVAKVYFSLVDHLDLVWFRDQLNGYSADTRWSVLARAAFKGDLDLIQRELTLGVIGAAGGARSLATRLTHWFQQHKRLIERWQNLLTDLRSTEIKDFAVLSVAIRELGDLAHASRLESNIERSVGVSSSASTTTSGTAAPTESSEQ